MNETTTGAPLTATVGERLGDERRVKEVREEVAHAARRPPGRAAARPFPWGALALAAVGWALVTGVGRGIRARARSAGSRVVRLARRLPGR
jgi:hypothetical protein